MRSFYVGCLVTLTIALVKGAPQSDEHKAKLQTYHKECLTESNVNEILVEKSKKGIFSDDPALKSFFYCFAKKAGFQNEQGTIDKDVFRRKIASIVEEDVANRLLNECTIEKDTPEETAFILAKCVRQVAPTIEFFKVAPEIVYLSNEMMQKFLLVHEECAAKDPLGAQTIDEARKQGILFEDPKFKGYIRCFFEKEKLLKEDGSIDKELFSERFADIIKDSQIVEQLGQKCIQKRESAEETAFFLSKCVQDNSPVYVELIPREFPVPDNLAKLIIQHRRECLKETKVDRELLEKARQGVFVEDPALKEFALCMAKKPGFLDEAGNVQIDVLREKTLKLISDPVLVEKLIDLCSVKKDSPQETAFYLHVCWYKNAPGHLSITQFGAVSQSQKEKRLQIIKDCARETEVSNAVVLSARKGDFVNDPSLKQYFFCINQKSDVLTETGEYKTDQMRKGLAEIYDATEADRIIQKCAKNLDNVLDTSFEGLKCFYHEAPEITVIF